MRTAHLPTVSHCVPCPRGEYPLSPWGPMSGKGEYPPMSHVRGEYPPPLDIPTPRSHLGRDLVPEIPLRQDMGSEIPPRGLTDTYENITFPQLPWRAVIKPLIFFARKTYMWSWVYFVECRCWEEHMCLHKELLELLHVRCNLVLRLFRQLKHYKDTSNRTTRCPSPMQNIV